MFVAADLMSTPNSAARVVKEWTFAEWMMFLLGRQAMFGHDPPISLRSTTAVRWPAAAIVQARYLPGSPLPMTRMSYSSVEDICSAPPRRPMLLGPSSVFVLPLSIAAPAGPPHRAAAPRPMVERLTSRTCHRP